MHPNPKSPGDMGRLPAVLLAFSLAFSLGLPRGVPAQDAAAFVAWPDTEVGRWAAAFFSALNTGEVAVLEVFVRRHYSAEYLADTTPAEIAAGFEGIRSQLGRLTVHSTTSDGDFALSIMVHSADTGLWLRFRIALNPSPPHDLAELEGAPAPPPPVERDYTDWTTLDELAEQVRHDSGSPGLAVAVVHAGVIETAAVGVRRQGTEEPVRVDDAFHVGSLTKAMTATVIGGLVEEGELRWDLTVAEALPALRGRAEFDGVSLEQLLRHQGGVPTMPALPADAPLPGTPAEGRAALVRAALASEPTAVPGARTVYSNAGYVAAAVMAERAAGASWEELMSRRLFEPAGMTSAGFGWPATERDPDAVRGHFGTPPELRVQELGEQGLGGVDLGTYLGPAGDVHASVADLARFARLHLDGIHGTDTPVGSTATIGLLHTPGIGPEGGVPYAGGWVVDFASGGEVHWHNGSNGTFYALIMLYPEDDLAVVVLQNIGLEADPWARRMAAALHRRRAQ